MITPDWPWLIREAQYLQGQWRENLGVNVMLTVADTYKELLERTTEAQFPVVVRGWAADYPDADNFLRVAVAFRSPWRSQDFDDLIEAAGRVGDQAERVKRYQAADRILIEEAAVIPLTYNRNQSLVKPWISKFPMSPMRIWHWKDVVIEPH